ncbi:putative xyloglucan endotransglucosylase/hydrolase protein 1 [Triticum dicoccoides]|uniref:putative xyloglucan endotransglucosylase/hydrolase protein 1 n=1 Tax=Triticum dicoccoides TaxID=85692 RepID=UPI000E797FE6|nr:putative xyloglucan endotransglucosylase/hydrolase protein 1 [Triticum dicoccoides]
MASSVRQPWPLLLIVLLPSLATATVFDDNYVPSWGADGYHLVDQGTETRLTMDRTSGAGFRSRSTYGSGFFHMRIKVPGGYTAGVITAFYLASEAPYDGSDRDEVDFEFLGNVDGENITLQTNVFVNGDGDREQRLNLWFDPAADFHEYKILWNPYQLVILVDDVPIRVLRNLTWQVPEYEFPAKQMGVRASLWDGSDWATDGGRIKIDWGRAPFAAGFQGFDVDACANTSSTPCDSTDLWWNARRHRRLSVREQAAYEHVRRTYMNYDYCADKDRFQNGKVPVECSYTT